MRTFSTGTAYICNTHWASFRINEWAEIVGVKILTPEKLPPRMVFEVRFEDGFIDYTAISDSSSYKTKELNEPQHLL